MKENKNSEISQLCSRLGEWASEDNRSRAAFAITLDSSSSNTADLDSTCVGHRLTIAAMIAKCMMEEPESYGMTIRMAMKMAENPGLIELALDMTGPTTIKYPLSALVSSMLKDAVRGVPGTSDALAGLVKGYENHIGEEKEGGVG